MSLLPVSDLAELADELNEYSTIAHNFGFGLHPFEIFNSRPQRSRWWPWNRKRDLGPVDLKSHVGKDGFQVCMDVRNFAPNEISVQTVGNSIVVEGNHEERQDKHGYISRQFKRRYDLPDGFDIKDVVSTLSSDGVLTVKAPPATKALENERVIQIQQTGPACLSIANKDAPESGKGKEKMIK